MTADGAEAGAISSAAADDRAGTVVLGSIRWRSRSDPLLTASGVRLVTVGSSD